MRDVSSKLIDECSELIHAICKAEKYGWENWNPEYRGRNNKLDVLHEIKDVEHSIKNLKFFLRNKLYK